MATKLVDTFSESIALVLRNTCDIMGKDQTNYREINGVGILCFCQIKIDMGRKN
jgi:hypothetical protein